jgi:hypothetical protein
MSYKISIDRYITSNMLKSVVQQLKEGNIVAFRQEDHAHPDNSIHITIIACGYMKKGSETKYVRLTNRQRRSLINKASSYDNRGAISINAHGDEIEYIDSLQEARYLP